MEMSATSVPLKRAHEDEDESSRSKRAHAEYTDRMSRSGSSNSESTKSDTPTDIAALIDDDPFTTAEHAIMDTELLSQLSKNELHPDKDLTLLECKAVLMAVVRASRGRLDEQYSQFTPNLDHIGNALVPIVQSTWKAQNFTQLRCLKVLQKNHPTKEVGFDTVSGKKATETAWGEAYVGDYHSMLITAIDDMVSKRKLEHHYWNYVPIVQSSGMGKSRLIDEVSKKLFCIPICLREIQGIPQADVVLRKKFVELRGQMLPAEWHPNPRLRFTEFVYDKIRVRYTVLLASVFTAVAEAVRGLDGSWSTHESLASAWYDYLQSSDADGMKHRDRIYLVATEAAGACDKDELEAELELLKASRQLYELIPPRRSENTKRELATKILISFDECHTISSNCFCLNEFRDRLVPRTPLDALLAALDVVRRKVFGVLLSTSSNLYTLSRPAGSDPSLRTYDTDLMYGTRQPPYVELPFDNYAGHIIAESELSMADVCDPEFLCRFGRPLWWTRVKRSPKELDQIFDFAMIKLIGSGSHSKLTDGGVFAALSTLLSLELDPGRQLNRETEAQQVASHMRVVYSVPAHREYLRSGSSSEPVLAEAAARVWDREDFDPLKQLTSVVQDGLVSKGDRGETAGKYILIRAMQEAIKNGAHEVRGPEKAGFSRWVRLRTYLEHLLPKTDLLRVFNARPYNRSHGPPLGDVFDNAWVRFSHFARAADPSMFQRCQNGCLALARGLVWQCPDRQRSIDFAMPFLFLPPDVAPETARLSRHNISWILFQLKNSLTDQESQMSICAEDLGMFADTKPKPYIVISKELGIMGEVGYIGADEGVSIKRSATSEDFIPVVQATPSALHVREGEDIWHSTRTRKEDPRSLEYWIAIKGCSPEVFNPKIVPNRDSFKALLASRALLVEHPRKTADLMSAVLNLKPFFVENQQTYFKEDDKLSELTLQLDEAVERWNEASTKANATDESFPPKTPTRQE